MKRIYTLLHLDQIKNQVLCYVLLISILPLIVLALFSIHTYNESIIAQSAQLVEDNLDTANGIVTLLSKDLIAFSRQILNNDTIREQMESYELKMGTHYLDSKTKQIMNKAIQKMGLSSNRITNVYLFSEDGFRYQYSVGNEGYHTFYTMENES